MSKKLNRNDPCKCGSGKKYKNCCQGKVKSGRSSKFAMITLLLAVVFGLIIIMLAISSSGAPVDCPPGTVWSDAHQHCH